MTAAVSSTPRHRFIARQYRLVTGVLTIGSLAVGMLLLERLVTRFHESFLTYYNVSTSGLQSASDVPAVSMSIGQFAVAVMALFGVISFVVIERIRIRRLALLERHCSRTEELRLPTIERPGLRELFDTFIRRSAFFGGVMLFSWVMQASYSNFVQGLGWGIQSDGWRTLLPLVSIFGLCVIVGLFVAFVSMYGIRVLDTLRAILAAVTRTARERRIAVRRGAECAQRTFRELFGIEILSRPPPARAV